MAPRIERLHFAAVAFVVAFVELCDTQAGVWGSPFGPGAGPAAGFCRGRLLGAAAATDDPRHSDDERTPPDRRKLEVRKRSSLPAIKLALHSVNVGRRPRRIGGRAAPRRRPTPPPTSLRSAAPTGPPMDHLLLGTAANKVHDRSLQASATQKWAASTTTEALADVFDDDDALSELRQTPALTQDAASLA